MNKITDEEAPCFIPVYVSNTSDNLPNPFKTQGVTEYMDRRELNITVPIPSFSSCFSRRNLDTRSKALERSKNPTYKVSLFALINEIISLKMNI